MRLETAALHRSQFSFGSTVGTELSTMAVSQPSDTPSLLPAVPSPSKFVYYFDLASQANPIQARDRFENEAFIWKTLSHEHILTLFHSTQTPYADLFFMLLCPASTLYDILKYDGRPAPPSPVRCSAKSSAVFDTSTSKWTLSMRT